MPSFEESLLIQKIFRLFKIPPPRVLFSIVNLTSLQPLNSHLKVSSIDSNSLITLLLPYRAACQKNYTSHHGSLLVTFSIISVNFIKTKNCSLSYFVSSVAISVTRTDSMLLDMALILPFIVISYIFRAHLILCFLFYGPPVSVLMLHHWSSDVTSPLV
jgi:hypothetical protein